MLLGSTQDSSPDSIAAKLQNVAQHILVVVFGLLPIYFIPLNTAPLIYSKVFIVVVAVFLSFILFAISVLRTGVLRISVPWPLLILWIIAAVTFVSAVFSGDLRDAIMGSEFGVHTAGFIAFLALTATVWMLTGNNKAAIMRLYLLLVLSSLLLVAFHLLRLILDPTLLSFGVFGDSAVASPIGAWNNLAVFFGLAVILALVALEQLKLTILGRSLFGVVTIAALIMLAIINFVAVWYVLALVSLVILVYSLTKGKFGNGKNEVMLEHTVSGLSVGISLATLLVSVVFIIGGSVLGSAISGITNISYIEVRPSLQATTNILKDVYVENAILGIGPNRFEDAWRLFKDPLINTTIFWNTDFQSGIGYVPTLFITTGIVGGIAWIAFLGMFVVMGVRLLVRASNVDKVWYFIATSSFVAGVYLWGISLFYVPGPVLLLFAAMCTGLVFAARAELLPGNVKKYRLISNPRSGFVVVTVVILMIVGSVAAMYSIGQHYASVYVFNQSLSAIASGEDIDTIEAITVRAYALSPDDNYARRIADYERIKLLRIISTGGGTDELQTQFRDAFTNGISVARTAVEIDQADPNNWGALGALYAAVVPLNIDDSMYEEALNALTKARELDPHNPGRLLTLAQLEFFRGNTDRVRELINEAIRLKSNYSDAVYFLAQLEIIEGNVPAAIESTRAAASLDPQNQVRQFQLGVLEISNDNPEAAEIALQRAIQIDPNYANARYFLALTYDRLGRPEDAKVQLERVLVLNPGNESVLDLLERLDRGEPIVDVAVPTEANGSSIQPVVDEQVPDGDEPVTSGEAPDTPLLTPVNVDTEVESKGESEPEIE